MQQITNKFQYPTAKIPKPVLGLEFVILVLFVIWNL